MQNEMNKFINGASFGLKNSYEFKEEKTVLLLELVCLNM